VIASISTDVVVALVVVLLVVALVWALITRRRRRGRPSVWFIPAGLLPRTATFRG